MPTLSAQDTILRLKDIDLECLKTTLGKYGLELILSPLNQAIPGSFWGDEEAGLIHNLIYARVDTPVHSILHESCHYICMTPSRRKTLHTNAGGTQDEENAVCYLQLLLCDESGVITMQRMMQDMDTWGYNFMAGSCKAWFEEDAQDARQWLKKHDLISSTETPTYTLRQ